MKAIRLALTPPGLVAIPLIASLVMWAVPWDEGMRTGYFGRADLTLQAAIVITTWYGTAIVVALLGYRFGRLTPRFPAFDQVPADRYYRYFTFLAVVGVGYTYLYIFREDPSLLMRSIKGATFNDVRSALPYSTGLHTLRYAATVSGAFAIAQIVRNRRLTPVDLLNVVALLATAVISSRLALVLSAMIVTVILTREMQFKSRPRAFVVSTVGVFVLFLALTAANYYRNANFYAENYDQENAFTASWFEAVTYLAAPFNASVATAAHVAELNDGSTSTVSDGMAQFLLPTYSPVQAAGEAGAQERYRQYVDMEESLTTNSVFASMYSSLGLVSFAVMPLVLFLAAAFAGHALNYAGRFYVAGIIVSYCFAEFWRVWLFNAGLIHFLILAFFVAPIILRVKTPKPPVRQRTEGTSAALTRRGA